MCPCTCRYTAATHGTLRRWVSAGDRWERRLGMVSGNGFIRLPEYIPTVDYRTYDHLLCGRYTVDEKSTVAA